jgi:hypothetical protein
MLHNGIHKGPLRRVYGDARYSAVDTLIGTRATTRMPIITQLPRPPHQTTGGSEMHGSSQVTPAPNERDRPATSNPPAILYQVDGTIITTAYFESGRQRYPLPKLADLQRVEHGGLLQSRMFELWARFEGQWVRLFHSYDAQEFGQVCRALTRAREHAGLA